MMTTAETLLNTFNETRSLSNYYFNKLKDTDINCSFEVNEIPLNSAKWIMAHLVWAEEFLILGALGGERISMDWFEKVAFGTPMCSSEELPDIETILSSMKTVHEAVIQFVPNLSDEFLEQKNEMGMKFGPNDSKRYLLMHAIRHEGTHAGQLGWLCKINQLKTA